jgi:hypothetical protein
LLITFFFSHLLQVDGHLFTMLVSICFLDFWSNFFGLRVRICLWFCYFFSFLFFFFSSAYRNHETCIWYLIIGGDSLDVEAKTNQKKTAAQLTTNKNIVNMLKESKNPTIRSVIGAFSSLLNIPRPFFSFFISFRSCLMSRFLQISFFRSFHDFSWFL